MKYFTHDILDPAFELLQNLHGVTQKVQHHPEIYVLEHSLQTVKWAFRESNDTDLILASLLHDVGKAVNTLGHDIIGAEMLDQKASTKTIWLVRNHMKIWSLILGEMKKLKKVTDLMGHPWLSDLVCLARWDKMARNPNKHSVFDPDDIIDKLNKCVESRGDAWKSYKE